MLCNLSGFMYKISPVDQCLQCVHFLRSSIVVFIFPGKAMHYIGNYFSLWRVISRFSFSNMYFPTCVKDDRCVDVFK